MRKFFYYLNFLFIYLLIFNIKSFGIKDSFFKISEKIKKNKKKLVFLISTTSIFIIDKEFNNIFEKFKFWNYKEEEINIAGSFKKYKVFVYRDRNRISKEKDLKDSENLKEIDDFYLKIKKELNFKKKLEFYIHCGIYVNIFRLFKVNIINKLSEEGFKSNIKNILSKEEFEFYEKNIKYNIIFNNRWEGIKIINEKCFNILKKLIEKKIIIEKTAKEIKNMIEEEGPFVYNEYSKQEILKL